jgi:hypothetical protein
MRQQCLHTLWCKAHTAAICRKPCFPCLLSCGMGGRRESERHPGCREAVPGTPGGRRHWSSCSGRGAAGGCAGAWARGTSGGAVSARGAESGMRGRLGWCGVRWLFPGCYSDGRLCPGPLLRESLIDYGNTPNNAYSQGGQELNTSAGAC